MDTRNDLAGQGSCRARLAPGIEPQPRKLRVARYSHDTMGLGHTRRNLLIEVTAIAALPTRLGELPGSEQADEIPNIRGRVYVHQR